eukprot:NODE_412_length_9112_cov_0.674692.p4 type:complete len:169 gc:universal NODE_412_length_9112_cov_0.674692:7663-8169(+)
MLFDAFSAMVFYGAYHTNMVNKICHIVFVPLIYLTTISFITIIGPYPLQWIIYCIYSVVYLCLEPLAFVLFAPIFHLLTLAGVLLPQYIAAPAIVSLHILSWTAQIYTHYAFEKRSPALKDNIVQALLMAPFFVWLEVLFMMNYRPALRKELNENINKKVTDLNKDRK